MVPPAFIKVEFLLVPLVLRRCEGSTNQNGAFLAWPQGCQWPEATAAAVASSRAGGLAAAWGSVVLVRAAALALALAAAIMALLGVTRFSFFGGCVSFFLDVPFLFFWDI